MCFLSPSGSSGDVTQNSYYNSRPWEKQARANNPNAAGMPGMYETAGAEKLAIGEDARAGKGNVTGTMPTKRSSLTTGGSA